MCHPLRFMWMNLREIWTPVFRRPNIINSCLIFPHFVGIRIQRKNNISLSAYQATPPILLHSLFSSKRVPFEKTIVPCILWYFVHTFLKIIHLSQDYLIVVSSYLFREIFCILLYFELLLNKHFSMCVYRTGTEL